MHSYSSEISPSSHEKVSVEDISFFIPKSLHEIGSDRFKSQLRNLGISLTNDRLKPRSTPNQFKELSPEKRFRHVDQVVKELTIPEKYRPTSIPAVIKDNITLAASAAVESERPIPIEIGPLPTITRESDLSHSLLNTLWFQHIGDYLTAAETTTHRIDANIVTDPQGESWVYEPLGLTPTMTSYEGVIPAIANLKEVNFGESKELQDIASQLKSSWKNIEPLIGSFLKKSQIPDWAHAQRVIRNIHKEMAFDYRQGRIGPTMAEYGTEPIELEEQITRRMGRLAGLGITELTPQILVDMCTMIEKVLPVDHLKTDKQITIPFTDKMVTAPTLDAAFRKIALELLYNQRYGRSNKIRIIPTDTTIYTKGFTRYAMTTSFPGSPEVGTIPAYEMPLLVSSRTENKTLLFTPLHESQYPHTNILTIEKQSKRFNIPLLVTDQAFRQLVV